MKKLLILAGGFVLLLAAAFVLYSALGNFAEAGQLVTVATTEAPTTEAPTTETPAEVPEETTTAPAQVALAPDFTVYDLEGNPVHLLSYLGKPIVLNFWASWCGPCKMEMPDFQKAFEELDGQVQFLMVNMTDGSRETVETAISFIESQGYTFPVLFDSDMDAAITYNAYSLPTTYFISAEGQVIARASGAISAELLQKGIDMIYTPED